MSRPFRFAIQTGPFDDPEKLRTFARSVESLGYDELYSYDHVGVDRPNVAVDPFVALLVAAEATTNLRVGPLVLNNEFHQPVLLARTAISVDQMTSGRLVLGLGTGYAQVEHDAMGMPLLPPGPRVTRFGETLQVVRDLCDTGACTFAGEHHNVAIADFGIKPTQAHIPILIGGHGRRVVSLAGQHADIFQFTGLTHAEDGTPSAGGFAMEHVVKRSDWLTEAAGARNAEIERSSLVQRTAVGTTAYADAIADAAYADYVDILDETPFMLVGSVEQIVDKLERLRAEVGISHYVVRDPEGFAPVVDALT